MFSHPLIYSLQYEWKIGKYWRYSIVVLWFFFFWISSVAKILLLFYKSCNKKLLSKHPFWLWIMMKTIIWKKYNRWRYADDSTEIRAGFNNIDQNFEFLCRKFLYVTYKIYITDIQENPCELGLEFRMLPITNRWIYWNPEALVWYTMHSKKIIIIIKLAVCIFLILESLVSPGQKIEIWDP